MWRKGHGEHSRTRPSLVVKRYDTKVPRQTIWIRWFLFSEFLYGISLIAVSALSHHHMNLWLDQLYRLQFQTRTVPSWDYTRAPFGAMSKASLPCLCCYFSVKKPSWSLGYVLWTRRNFLIPLSLQGQILKEKILKSHTISPTSKYGQYRWGSQHENYQFVKPFPFHAVA